MTRLTERLKDEMKLHLLSVDVLTDVSHFLVDLVFMFFGLMELPVGFLKLWFLSLQMKLDEVTGMYQKSCSWYWSKFLLCFNLSWIFTLETWSSLEKMVPTLIKHSMRVGTLSNTCDISYKNYDSSVPIWWRCGGPTPSIYRKTVNMLPLCSRLCPHQGIRWCLFPRWRSPSFSL